MPTVFKPTRKYIEALVQWCGGSMTALPYNVQWTGTGTDKPSPTETTSVGGFFGQFWYDVLQDMKFNRLEILDLLEGDEILSFPEGFELKIPPTAPAKVGSAVDQVNTADPQVKCHLPEGFRSADIRNALERKFALFGKGLLQLEERNSDTSPLRDQSTNTIAYGLGVRTIGIDITGWPDKPKKNPRERLVKFNKRMEEWHKKRRSISPFVARSVHPLNVAYDRSHTPPKWAVIREPTTEWDAAEEYPAWRPRSRDRDDFTPGAQQRPLTKVWYITPDYVACYIDGVIALGPEDGADDQGVAKNPYGRINYWFSAGGSGDQDPYGRPQYELCGIIRKNHGVLLADASIFNQEEIVRQRLALGPKPWVRGPDPVERARILGQVLGNPLKGVDSEASYNIEYVKNPEMPPALADQRARVNADIDRGMVYDVASGAGTPTEPAARTRVRLFQVDKRFATAVIHIKQTVEASLEAALYMIRDVLKEPVGVNVAQVGQPAEYIDIKPEEIPDGVIFEVDLIGDSEEEKARLLQIGDRRLANGTLDKKTYMTDYAKDRDPEEIMLGVIVDQLHQAVTLPALVAFMQGQAPSWALQAMESEGVQFSQEEMNAAMQAMTGGGGGPAGGGAGAGMPGDVGGQVGPNGAVLPGEGDNPQVSRPNSPEAMNQRMRLEQQNGAMPAAPPVVRRM